jgi:glycosyltransferase involved in cell wall biosynthesis
MKVAVVATSPARGGAEQYLYRLYRRLQDEYDVMPTLVGALPDWPTDLGPTIPVQRSQKLTMRKSLVQQGVSSLVALAEILTILRRNRFDLVHIQFFEPKLLLPRLVAQSTPIIWTEHGPLPTSLPGVGMRLLRLQSRSAQVIAVSKAVHDSLADHRIDSTVIWNPLPMAIAPAHAAADDRTSASYPKRILYAGRLHRAKRVSLLLDAARLLPDVEVVVAGDGPDRDSLEAQAPGNVEFVGSLPSVQHLIEGSDAVVICSGAEAREGSPMIALEARQAAVSVLMASDCHAAGEVQTLGGTLFAPTSQGLALAITALERGRPDPLDSDVRSARSEAVWAQRHYEIMRGALSLGAL